MSCCAIVLDPVVTWRVEMFYQRNSKDLSLLLIYVEIEVWPNKSLAYQAVKIFSQLDSNINFELPLCWQREVMFCSIFVLVEIQC